MSEYDIQNCWILKFKFLNLQWHEIDSRSSLLLLSGTTCFRKVVFLEIEVPVYSEF